VAVKQRLKQVKYVAVIRFSKGSPFKRNPEGPSPKRSCPALTKAKLAQGELIKVLGPASEERVQYLKWLHHYGVARPLKPQKAVLNSKIGFRSTIHDFVNARLLQTEHGFRDLRDRYTFSVDPAGCCDVDDAISYLRSGDSHFVGVHIANVSWWLDRLGIQPRRHFSVYSPAGNRGIFSKVLSNHFFPLKAGHDRLAVSLMLEYTHSWTLKGHHFEQSIVRVNKNVSYSNKLLDKNRKSGRAKYAKLFHRLSQGLCGTYDSHSLVDHLMVLANRLCGEFLTKNNCKSIMRMHEGTSAEHKEDSNTPQLPPKVARFVGYYLSASARYALFAGKPLLHASLGIQNYAQMTSPIRRSVDIYNHRLLRHLIVNLSNSALAPRSGQPMTHEQVRVINEAHALNKKLHRRLDAVQYSFQEHSGECTAFIIDISSEGLHLYLERDGFLFVKPWPALQKLVISPSSFSFVTQKGDKRTVSRYQSLSVTPVLCEDRLNFTIHW
jgi:exoribonuclease R